jgi:hypothetical protein
LKASVNQLPIDSLSAGAIDTAIAPWVFSHATDVEKSITKLARASRSRIALIQGAPDNEIVQLINSVARSLPVSHQGHILSAARKALVEQDFTNVSSERIRARFDFPEKDTAARCAAAADFLLDIWHRDHPQKEEMRVILTDRLHLQFQGQENAVGFDLVAVLATRPE